MMSFLSKTFGGLSKGYYIRQFLFGLLFFIFLIYIGYDHYNRSENYYILATNIVYGLVSLILYPYSRFTYEGIVEYIVGNNIFITDVLFMMTVKLITMAICYFFALFISPIGLIWLYFYYSKQEKIANQSENQ
ncbi:hypothetical protein [Aggregatibacter actinomycetemcomitans]|uniref:hypothetical protein n=2 Tax=Aggregatibacter actinomycetemcomitans TaxID=714 RepID=UPI001EE664F9|nr:hypothetical protein [Aggregatibacter actinomycetemcomitans]